MRACPTSISKSSWATASGLTCPNVGSSATAFSVAVCTIGFSGVTVSGVVSSRVSVSANVAAGAVASSPVSVRGASPVGPRDLPFVNTSTNAWKIPPAVPPIAASSSTPVSTSSRSGLYPRSAKFCSMAEAASCAPSITPVLPALTRRCSIRFKKFAPSIGLSPNFSTSLSTPGTRKNLRGRSNGIPSIAPASNTSLDPMASSRASSETPASLARSLAIPRAAPYPNPPRTVPLASEAASPANAAGARAAAPRAVTPAGAAKPTIEPKPADTW